MRKYWKHLAVPFLTAVFLASSAVAAAEEMDIPDAILEMGEDISLEDRVQVVGKRHPAAGYILGIFVKYHMYLLAGGPYRLLITADVKSSVVLPFSSEVMFSCSIAVSSACERMSAFTPRPMCLSIISAALTILEGLA